MSEAPPYLLRGGREAVHHGAPHEAELALRSGMPDLRGADRTEAALVLAEAQQEQGSWSESVAALAAAEFAGEAEQQRAIVLRTIATRRLGMIPPADIPDSIRLLEPIIQAAAGADSRASALYAAASLLGDLPDRSQATRLEGISATIPIDELTVGARAQLFLGRAILAYYRRDREASLRYVTSAADELVASEAANSTLAMLWIGISALRCSVGCYAAALPECERAYALALRLSNVDLAGQAAANASTCYGRLGEYANQVSWSTRALEALGTSMVGGHALQAARNRAMGLAMLGRFDEAKEAIRAVESSAVRVGGWIEQAYHLYSADVYMLAGRFSEAAKCGRRGIDDKFEGVRFDGLAGPYSRWLAIDAFRDGRAPRHEAAIAGLVARLSEFDALDQIEIVLGDLLMRKHDGSTSGVEAAAAMRARLAALPPAVTAQLERLYPVPITRLLRPAELPK